MCLGVSGVCSNAKALLKKMEKNAVLKAAVMLAGVFTCVLVWSAYSWARIEEETIHIFPSQASGSGWQNVEGALEQGLSGNAITSDFSSENSAFILFNPDPDAEEISVIDAVASSTDDTLPETGTTTAVLSRSLFDRIIHPIPTSAGAGVGVFF